LAAILSMKNKQLIKDINQGDCLTFKTSDNRYKVIFCTSTYKEKSPQTFTFAPTTFDKDLKPNLGDISDTEFYGKGNSKNEFFKYSDKELEKMWTFHPNNKPYFLGTYGILILRKEFMKMRENFELLGNLLIVDNLDKNGSGSFYPGNIDNLDNFLTKDLELLMEQRGQYKFKFRAILKD
jgi:hypothetical protein